MLFIQDGDKGFVQELADRLDKNNNNIAGMFAVAAVTDVAKILSTDNVSAAIPVVERQEDVYWQADLLVRILCAG